MRRKRDAEMLRQIAGIRDLQHIAAEAKAARAASALRNKDKVRSESEHQRQFAEESWLGSLSAPPLRMEMSNLWSAELLRQEQVVLRATSDFQAAANELERRTAGWHAAATRRDAAQVMVRKAMKDRIRRREEVALQDASDRHAQRWSDR